MPYSRDIIAERVIQATTPSLKEHISSPDLLLEFVTSLDASAYKFWNEPKDTVTQLIHTLYNNNIPTNITATIKEIRYVFPHKASLFFYLDHSSVDPMHCARKKTNPSNADNNAF